MHSYIATSMCCPRPVLRRVSKASTMLSAAHSPGMESPMLSPTACGGPSGSPVISIHPAMACIAMLLAGQLEYGPVSPSLSP